MKTDTRSLIERIFGQPTAPFREGYVLAELASILSKNQIPYFFDECKNLVAGFSSAQALTASGFRVVLLAHTDHPGFHIYQKLSSRKYLAKWFGGAPFSQMLGAQLRVHDPKDKSSVAATITNFSNFDPAKEGQIFEIELAKDSELSLQSFGGFDFAGSEIHDNIVSTRAADDLAGCVIALGALIDQKNNPGSRLSAVFTRAEEVGFIGCLNLLKQNILPKESWCISLEASRQLPEAEITKGPVLRIGDRTFVFDPEFCAVLWKIAQDLAKEDQNFIFQRRLMSGGTCEATPLCMAGFKTAGLAVPLLNYHNAGDTGPAPEKISVQDVDLARRFCDQVGKVLTQPPTWREDLEKRISAEYVELKDLLYTDVRYESNTQPSNESR